MAPIPSACQPVADRVAALEGQYTTLAGQASALVGAPAWTALAQLGGLLEQLTITRNELDACVTAHAAALTGTVVVMDASGGAPAGQQTVTLWDLTGAGPVTRDASPVQAGAFGFQGPLPAQAALTVQTAGVADLTGLDFRSGPLVGPLDGQTPRIELVLGPAITVPAALLSEWATAFKVVTQNPITLGGGAAGLAISVGATISSLAVALSAGAIVVTATGTVSGGYPGLESAVPVSAKVSVGIVPANAPHVDDVVSVTLAGSNPVTVSAGVGADLLGSLASWLAPFVGPLIQQSLNVWANQVIASAIASGLALAQLPAETRLSLRSIGIDSTGITLQPVLGLIGTGLSTFQPKPVQAPPAP